MTLEIDLLVIAILIGFSAFFSGIEVALVSIRKSRVEQLVKQKVRGAKALQKLKSDPGRMMASVLLGNNLVNVAAAAVATQMALGLFGDQGVSIVIGILTFAILVFGEITPKTYCNANAVKIALRFSPVLLVFTYAFYPVIRMLEGITRGMIKMTGSSYYPPGLTLDEIKGIVDQGLQDKAIEKHEHRLVHGALKFDDTVIRAVMMPRTKMFMLHSKMLLGEALPLINQSGHSRIPIYGKNRDEIVGIIHVRDILKQLEKDQKMIPLDEVAREPIFASQEKMVSSLLTEMKGRQMHMAIVIDEFGGVEGLVTLEDLIEEIVGEIRDETDVDKQQEFHALDKNTIITNGDIEIDKINEIFKTNIPQGENYASLNGLLHEKLRDIPHEGDKVEVDSLRIIVEKVSKNRPEKIRIERI